MTKLGEILEKLRKNKKNQKLASTKLFQETINESPTKKRQVVIFRVLIFFLLIGSILGGFITVKILEEFLSIRKNNIGEKVVYSPPERALTRSQEVPNTRSPDNESSKVEKAKVYEQIKRSERPFKAKSSEKKRSLKPVKIEQKKYTLAKKNNTVKERPSATVYSSPSGPPILRERELLRNLLLNAEEEVSKGNYLAAKNFYEKYLAKVEDPVVYNNYGNVLFMLGDYKLAEQAFAKALYLRKDPVFKLNLILAKLKLNQYYSACQMFREAQSNLEKFEESAIIKEICTKKGY